MKTLLLTIVFGASASLADQAGEKACERIIVACQGINNGKACTNVLCQNRLERECRGPLLAGKKIANVSGDPGDLAACRKQMGQGRRIFVPPEGNPPPDNPRVK